MPVLKAGNPTEGGAFQLIPDGDYYFEVVDAKDKQSSNKNDMIELKCKIDGRYVWDNLVFTEKAYWKINQFLASVGLHPGDGQEIMLDASECIGQKGRMTVGHEQGQNGKDRNVVVAYLFEEF